MFRMLAVSDSHGDRRTLYRILDSHREANAVLFLGDGYADVLALQDEFAIRAVAGNCDGFSCEAPAEHEMTVGGKRIFAVHGHHYSVKHTLLRLSLAAQSRGADVALFGHTHMPCIERVEGLFLVNPGSVRDGGRYALIDIQDGAVFPHLERL